MRNGLYSVQWSAFFQKISKTFVADVFKEWCVQKNPPLKNRAPLYVIQTISDSTNF